MIDSRAVVHPKAELAEDVSVGPFSVIGPEVQIDAGTEIGPHVVIRGPTAIGRDNKIYQFSSIGEDPQDKKYADEVTRLEIGDRNVIREFCTMHRGTLQDKGLTLIGSDNLFMAYTHVAHDCEIGDHVIMANGASIAGHVHIGDHAILGGFTLVHQFTQIGEYSFSAMGSAITQDIPPFVMVGGRPTRPHGINSVGMERNGKSPEVIRQIRQAYKILYKNNLRLEDAIEEMEGMAGESNELSNMVSFLRNVTRGILR
ncbi:acyl-ACP--UDP-N-acetylglucosamine O-acyltransferase [Methylomonas sp. MED-D]|uniref:Acyl-[acyl-carrier-protein]--UDP-N-acetylglucosamine O-acyltransferase n=1 Tax=Methylomonas koyamae TaxID=702114 RepID=A0A177NFL0_9GAMM|nr:MULTISPECIES: acyl-ACP--UDP-N-acetylglucosamine O-acyltransferase [Methylomonas]NJA07969.1 acyl-ACP--UDP-N-acetylglucosamine O-acyltransferase [Methylococcaceae bacterium WWC4]MDT4329215.1 acyl-ACP--UDP-N-acetylglucosamine O-acyltransferase [Methylomonas sp. MV1]OAI16414.1 acyl-[acyl-carrier-protein]--UDP-N-acetylglucosamine O-acyltransferase [Methylomonas koyamae]OHX36850.1 acyl-[acyl-carrier-protein]--UDP-N-acetylglucosamine O-acyltransferase [Methylomonas sp. LWB]WGS87584.1 acyl-ACP--UDP